MAHKVIVSCSRYLGETQPWFGPEITGEDVHWICLDDRPVYWWERKIRRPNLAMARTALQATLEARKRKASLLFLNDAGASVWCGLASLVFRSKTPYCAFTFNFPKLPSGIKRSLTSFALRRISEIFVHSTMERRLYSKHFNTAMERFKVRLWATGKPRVWPEYPLQAGRYVSAIGGNGRDYRTLIEASKLARDIPLVIVAPADAVRNIQIPEYVQVLHDIPFEEAMNVLQYSEFMVLPLKGSTMPCGHVTLVCAMHLGKAVIATDSEGISDYVEDGKNALLSKPSSPKDLAAAIEKLWNDPQLTARLSAANKAFGAAHCTEDVARLDFAELLSRYDLLTPSAVKTSG